MICQNFEKFLAVLQSGDQQAAEAALREIEPSLKSIIRLRLIDGRLQRIVDSMDILQSLVKDFLGRKDGGRLAEADIGLDAYLAAAVRNKVIARLRKEQRHAGSIPEGWDAPIAEASSGGGHDFRGKLRRMRDQLEERDRALLDMRAEGLTWPQVSEKVGLPHATLRIRLGRAIARILPRPSK